MHIVPRDNEKETEGSNAPGPSVSEASSDGNLRRCLITGEFLPKDELIRFVLSPDNVVTPDVTGKLPGRGLWLSSSLDVLEKAAAKNPFSHAAKCKAVVPPDLVSQTQALLLKRFLSLLGLARSAGLVLSGQPQVEDAAKSGKLSLVIVADDAGSDGMKKLAHLPTLLIRGPSRTDLGAALGHDHLVYLGLLPHSLTEKAKIALIRWQKASFRAMKNDKLQETE